MLPMNVFRVAVNAVSRLDVRAAHLTEAIRRQGKFHVTSDDIKFTNDDQLILNHPCESGQIVKLIISLRTWEVTQSETTVSEKVVYWMNPPMDGASAINSDEFERGILAWVAVYGDELQPSPEELIVAKSVLDGEVLKELFAARKAKQTSGT